MILHISLHKQKTMNHQNNHFKWFRSKNIILGKFFIQQHVAQGAMNHICSFQRCNHSYRKKENQIAQKKFSEEQQKNQVNSGKINIKFTEPLKTSCLKENSEKPWKNSEIPWKALSRFSQS